MPPPSLSVIIPVFNEPRWIHTVVDDLFTAFGRSPFPAMELIIVDDGSDQETRDSLARLGELRECRIIRQENQGRFHARLAGLRAATQPLVLLVDSRVSLDPDALAFVAAHPDADGRIGPWNGHVRIDVSGNLFARFWNVLTDAAFFEYFGNPRTTSFGLEEFDRFPKGTGCFLADRDALLRAVEEFDSHFDDMKLASDDTPIIRAIAAERRINISPGFSCVYRARNRPRAFLKHTFDRGTHLVDGYLRPGARFRSLILAVPPATMLGGALLLRFRWARLASVIAVPVAAVGAAVRFRRSATDALALMLVGPPWTVAYVAGVWRGLFIALKRRPGT
ncbi:MAG: glycosyltransferase family 2 protein [Actinobacteria bacterium]|nr:glycosyltransferase family 2 protein [Actinomycetota bacterium]